MCVVHALYWRVDTWLQVDATHHAEALPKYHLDLPQVPSEETVCRACHYMGPTYAAGEFTHGEMKCLTCHINLKEKQVVPTGHVQGDDE